MVLVRKQKSPLITRMKKEVVASNFIYNISNWTRCNYYGDDYIVSQTITGVKKNPHGSNFRDKRFKTWLVLLLIFDDVSQGVSLSGEMIRVWPKDQD